MKSLPALLAVLGVWAGFAAVAHAQAAPNDAGFANWAVVVVAGDNRSAHDDTPTETFDNARRDVVAALTRRGFNAANIAQFSVNPDRYPADHAGKAGLGVVFTTLEALADKATAGCLVYITSHGSPEGVVMNDRLVPPKVLASMTGRACGVRPTAVILSACFSGVFVPALKAPERLVLTAARRDRSSFGCGEADRYPFFDACVIQALPTAQDFVELGDRARRCVADREDKEGMRPRSEPQLWVGPTFKSVAPAFAGPAAAQPDGKTPDRR